MPKRKSKWFSALCNTEHMITTGEHAMRFSNDDSLYACLDLMREHVKMHGTASDCYSLAKAYDEYLHKERRKKRLKQIEGSRK